MSRVKFKTNLRCSHCHQYVTKYPQKGKVPPSAFTSDHTPQESIYSSQSKKECGLIEVPSCFHCDNSRSKDQELFRAMLAVTPGRERSPSGRALWEDGSLQKTLTRPKYGLWNTLEKRIQPVFLEQFKERLITTPSGIILGNALRLRPSDEETARLDRLQVATCEGLHWFESGGKLAPLESNYYIICYVNEGDTITQVRENFSGLFNIGKKTWPGTFEYGYLHTQGLTAWLMYYWMQYLFIVIRVDKDQSKINEGFAANDQLTQVTLRY